MTLIRCIYCDDKGISPGPLDVTLLDVIKEKLSDQRIE